MSEESLKFGKLRWDVLRSIIYTHLGQEDARVLVGPRIGEDAAIIDFGDRVFVTHSDPITGAIENIGSLAVMVSTNDVASRGAKPRWITVVVFLPENSSTGLLRTIMEQIDSEAKKLGVAVVGGHTEVTPGFNRPVLAVTAMGEAPRDRYVTSGGARIGDSVIMTKGAAIEGTAILASELHEFLDGKVDPDLIDRGRAFFEEISIAKEAEIAMETGGVTAMHDATEGGVAGALQELAMASDLGVTAYEEKIFVNPETEAIFRALGADPMRTISSGTLVIAAKPESAQPIVDNLRARGVKAFVAGEFTDKGKGLWLMRRDGSRFDLSEPVQDQLWIILGKYLRERTT
jgi:hydrogenase expression/formation protein HypE